MVTLKLLCNCQLVVKLYEMKAGCVVHRIFIDANLCNYLISCLTQLISFICVGEIQNCHTSY